MTQQHGLLRRLAAVAAVVLALVCMAPALSWAQDEVKPADKTWTFNPNESDELAAIGTVQEGSDPAIVEYDGITIDATNGKFSPRLDGDTQVNAKTVLTIPVEASTGGAVLTVETSGGTTTFDVEISNGGSHSESATVASPATIEIPAGDAVNVTLTFTVDSYLSNISLVYGEPPVEYPGTPKDVQALDKTWDLSVLGSEAADLTVQNERGELDGILIDATAEEAKFAPRDGDTQVNVGTVIYVPLAQDAQGAVLTVAANANGTVILVDGEELPADGRVTLDCAESRYVKIEVKKAELAEGQKPEELSSSSYFNAISVDYDSDTSTYPGVPENVTATDTTWNLAEDVEGVEARPTVNAGSRADWAGVRIDAMAGGAKFGPRDGDTQVSNNTVLYLPLAPEAEGATLRLEGNNYNNLVITVDGTEQKLGTDIALTTADAPRYVKVEFSLPEDATGDSGSCYLTSIAIDYATDDEQAWHVVTVGVNGKYQSINDALANETSSLKDHLVLSIAPGYYHERVVVDQPGVIFQNADPTAEQPVVIHESYYSSNTFDANGNFVPQDKYDLGTDQSATVLIEASGTGFEAFGITFQNDYNVVDHTEEDSQTPAVAFNSKADKVSLQECRFIGRQDTLYLQGAGNRVYMDNCYVEGTVDFIFGDADALIESSTLHMAAFTGRDSGFYTAANTKKGYTGLVFANCTLTADPSVTDVSLGRPWQNLAYYTSTDRTETGSTEYIGLDTNRPHPDYANVSSAVTFVGCTMPQTLKSEHWNRWTGHVPDKEGSVSVTYDETVRFAEVSCTYLGGEADESQIALGKLYDTDVSTELDLLRDQMHIGSAYNWDPASFTRITDRGVQGGWTTDPLGPSEQQPTTPQTKPAGNTDNKNTLAATGDAILLFAGVAVIGAAAVAAGLRLRSRQQ